MIKTSFCRKICVMFAMVLLSFFAFPCMQWNVHADDNDDRMLYNNYIYYTINSSNEVVIQDVRASITEAEIPAEIDGYSVTEIGNYAFQNCIALESITLSQGLTVINVGIFDGCTSLTQITILNPECIIADDSTTLSEQADIYGMVVSTANTYAIKYAHKFTALDWMRGDYDGDGILTVQDAYQILVVFASDSAGVPQTLTDTEIYAADYNDDVCINTQDAYAVMVAFAQSADGC